MSWIVGLMRSLLSYQYILLRGKVWDEHGDKEDEVWLENLEIEGKELMIVSVFCLKKMTEKVDLIWDAWFTYGYFRFREWFYLKSEFFLMYWKHSRQFHNKFFFNFSILKIKIKNFHLLKVSNLLFFYSPPKIISLD